MLDDTHILLVEDDEDDYLLTKLVLDEIQAENLNLVWVQDYDRGLSYLAQNRIDVCLIDYRIGAHTGIEFLKVAKDRGFRCPVILLTGVGQHDIDVAATEAGASDFIDKSDLSASLMERSIRFALANAKALDALAEQSSFLAATLEYSGAGIAALDSDCNLTTFNHQFDELLSEYMVANIGNPKNARQQAIRHLAQRLAEAPRHELEFESAEGRVFEIRKNPTPHGGMVIFAVDVTDQKAFEADLINAKAEVEAASRAKSSFLANMSHEFRTPLHGIMGFSDLIMQQAENDQIKEFVQQISDSSVHLLEIINTVLAYSRLEAGQHPFDSRELLDIDYLVDFCIKQVLPKASENGISICKDIDPQLISLECDMTSVRRILINLLSNAVRFSTKAGKVVVALKVDESSRLRLSVQDSGIGMKPEQVDKAFLPFHQIGGGYDRQCDGTGLGLPMVKSLAELHDAKVGIETSLGVGTCVTVIFPAERVVHQSKRCALSSSESVERYLHPLDSADRQEPSVAREARTVRLNEKIAKLKEEMERPKEA